MSYSTALRIGGFGWSECLQPLQGLTGPKDFITNSSSAPTANPIFVYFKFLTNLRPALHRVVLITNQLSAGCVRGFATRPNYLELTSGRCRDVLWTAIQPGV